jgi:hypothetical protein
VVYNGCNLRVNVDGYLVFSDGPNKGKRLHRIVYEEHYGPIPEGYTVHHKDEDRLNFDPDNLECMTGAEHNSLHHSGKLGAFTGRLHSEKTKQKMSEAQLGKSFTKEHKKRLSAALSGKQLTYETRQKMSAARTGEKNPMYGKKFSEETKRKMSEARKLYWQKCGGRKNG